VEHKYPFSQQKSKHIQSIIAAGEGENDFVKDCWAVTMCSSTVVTRDSQSDDVILHFSLFCSCKCVVLSHQLTPPWFSFHSRNHYFLFVCLFYIQNAACFLRFCH